MVWNHDTLQCEWLSGSIVSSEVFCAQKYISCQSLRLPIFAGLQSGLLFSQPSSDHSVIYFPIGKNTLCVMRWIEYAGNICFIFYLSRKLLANRWCLIYSVCYYCKSVSIAICQEFACDIETNGFVSGVFFCQNKLKAHSTGKEFMLTWIVCWVIRLVAFRLIKFIFRVRAFALFSHLREVY